MLVFHKAGVGVTELYVLSHFFLILSLLSCIKVPMWSLKIPADANSKICVTMSMVKVSVSSLASSFLVTSLLGKKFNEEKYKESDQKIIFYSLYESICGLVQCCLTLGFPSWESSGENANKEKWEGDLWYQGQIEIFSLEDDGWRGVYWIWFVMKRLVLVQPGSDSLHLFL